MLGARTLLSATVVLLCSAGCSSEPEVDCAYLDDLRIGGTELSGDGFVAWVDGATPELITGPQGSEHVWLSFRTPTPFAADRVATRTALRLLDTGEVVPPGISPVTIRVERFDDGQWGYSGLRAFVRDSCPVHNKPHTAWFELTAPDGCQVTRRITVLPQWKYYAIRCTSP